VADHEHECQGQHQREGDHPLPQELPNQGAGLWGDVPHLVEGVLKLDEDRQGSDHERRDSDDPAQNPAHLEGGVSEHRLDRPGLLVSHEQLELSHDLRVDGARVEDEAGAGGEEHQDRGEREKCEEREGRALRERVALDPGAERRPQDRVPKAGARRGDASVAHRE